MQPSAAIKDRVSLVLPPGVPSVAQAMGHLSSQMPPWEGYDEPFPLRRQMLCQSQAGSLGRASLLLTCSHSPALVAQRGVKAPQSLSSTQVPQRARRIFATPMLYQYEAEPQGSTAKGLIFLVVLAGEGTGGSCHCSAMTWMPSPEPIMPLSFMSFFC